MRNSNINHYERSFANWLMDNNVRYIAVDEHKRAAFGKVKIKSFDYLIFPPNQRTILAEVKGRIFKGTSLAGLKGFDCWVTADDIEGLSKWQKVFGPDHIAAFIFSYHIKKIDVDFDGREIYKFNDSRYIFFALRLDDYLKYMKVRSPKWRTLTLPADKFRLCAIQMQNLLAQ